MKGFNFLFGMKYTDYHSLSLDRLLDSCRVRRLLHILTAPRALYERLLLRRYSLEPVLFNRIV